MNTERIFVGKYSELRPQMGRKIIVKNEEIALFKSTSNNVYAISNRSPHPKGGVLAQGLVSGEFVFCPVYDWKISLVDGSVQAPDCGQVKTYSLEIESDDMYLVL
ncbi:MAG: nitrite reductase small subunit NirD [Bacilli bacterium]